MFSTIKMILPSIIASLLTLSIHAQTSDFKIIKERVLEELMKTGADDQRVDVILGRMATDGSFQDINYEDLSRTAGFPHRRHTSELVNLAKAYKNKDSKFHQNRQLKEKIITSLKYWVDHDFVGDNWHDNQIT